MQRPEPHVVEAGQRLSQSLIWRLQRQYFQHHGVAAFSRGTLPHYITSNTFIAQCYAHVVLGYLRDLQPSLDSQAPIYFVELGAGTGRFGFHFLTKFSALLEQSPLRGLRWCYVLTDFTTSYLNAWLAHPALRPFVAAGNLDFALFDVSQPGALKLQHAGAVLAPGAVKNPLVVLANYVFDGIPQDAFRLQDGQLYESLVTLTSFQPEPDVNARGLLERLDVLYESRLVSSDYYDDPACNRLLRTYVQSGEEGMLLFPSATLSCIGYLQRLCNNRLLLLTGDKGSPTAKAALPQSAPELTHHGSISMMVNYRALGEYVVQEGGQVLTTTHRHTHLNVSAFLFGDQEHSATRFAYASAVQAFGPDDFFLLKKGFEAHLDGLAVEQILALLRFSGWDYSYLLECYAPLLRSLPQASEPWQQEVRHAITAVWDNFYPIGEPWDLPYHLGMLLCALGDHHEAEKYFHHSLELHGPSTATQHGLALCHAHRGESKSAASVHNPSE